MSNWYKKSQQGSSMYVGYIEVVANVVDGGDREEGLRLASEAISKATTAIEPKAPSFAASKNPNVYIESIKFTPQELS